MRRIWNIVLTLAAIILGFGIVGILVGSFTGGSPERMVNLIFGGPEELKMVIDLLKTEIFNLF